MGDFISKLHFLDKEVLIKVLERFLTEDPQNIKFFEKQKYSELYDLEIDSLILE